MNAIKPKIFISYSHSDQQWAREFAETMKSTGLDVWFDEFNIKAGQPLSEAIEKGLRESGVLVLVINAENVARPNLFFELGAALGMTKTIIPIIPKDLDLRKLPLPLQRIRFLTRKSPKETAKELESAIDAQIAEPA